MIVLKLSMLEGRTKEQKNELIRRLTESAAEHLQEPAESIRVIITDIPPSNWGAGGTSIEEKQS